MATTADEKRTEPAASSLKRWPIQKLAIEVFSIVLGVLLALAVNEWNEQRSHEIQANSALQNISNELISNLEVLKLIHENNTATVDAITAEQDSESEKNQNFIPGLQLQETAWDTLLSTGLSNYVQYERILVLSRAYSMLGLYKNTGLQLTNAAMTASAYAAATGTQVDNDAFTKEFINYFEMLLQIEEILLTSFQESLDQLDSQ
jgi:hypothetical protein